MLRRYAETRYAAKSWGPAKRRVAARIEASSMGLDIRFVVTSIETGTPEHIFDTLYARGLMVPRFRGHGLGHLSFGLFRGPVSDSEAELYAAECMIADACRRDAGENVLRKAASTKMFASEAVDRCVQIHGGAGYLAEYEAERFFRDSRVFRIYEGTAQILQLFIAKSMLRQFATEN